MKYLYSIFSILIIICNTIFMTIYQVNELNTMANLYANDLQSDKSIKIIVAQNENLPYEELYNLVNNYNIVIFNEIYNDKALKVWGVIGKSFSKTIASIEDNSYDLISNDSKFCLVGENLYTNNKYFEFKGIQYPITSIVNNNLYSMLDNTVFIEHEKSYYNASTGFIIDSNDNNEITEAIRFLDEKYDICTYKNNNFIQQYIFDFLNFRLINSLSFLIIIVVYTLCIYILNFGLKTEICTKYLLGIDKIHIIKDTLCDILRCYTRCEILFFSTYYLLFFLFVREFNLKLIDIKYLIFTVCIISAIITDLICWIQYIGNNLKENIYEEI